MESKYATIKYSSFRGLSGRALENGFFYRRMRINKLLKSCIDTQVEFLLLEEYIWLDQKLPLICGLKGVGIARQLDQVFLGVIVGRHNNGD